MTASQAVDTSPILVFRKICVEMYKMIQFKNETYKRDFNEKTYLVNYKQC